MSEPDAETSSVAPRPQVETPEVSLRDLGFYAGPVVGLSTTLFIVQFYFLKFATDVLLLAPAAIGLLFGAGRIWDAVSDPLAGYWSDRTRTRLGRRRPWMLVAIP